MKRLALATLATIAVSAAPALAAPPSAFMATGTATSFATADAPEQTTPVKLFYQGGKIRIEMQPPGGGKSVILAKRGSKQVTMLDPVQKLAMVSNLSAVQTQDGMPSMDQIMDMASWKAQLKTAKRLAGSEVKGSEQCSLWEKTTGQTTFKVWFADKLELPMQIEGKVGGKPRFRFSVSGVKPGPQASTLFAVPSGYQTTELDLSSLQQR